MNRPARPLVAAGAVLVGALVVAAAVGPLLAPYDPHAPAGLPFEAPSAAHWLGTNDVGQDVASQLLHGARWALLVAVAAAGLSVAVGVLVGVAAGLFGGGVDLVTMRTVDLFLALPGLPLLMVVVAFAGPGRATMIAVIGLFSWPWTARIVRAQTLSLRSRGFVEAAGGFGARPGYVMRRHLVPAVAPLAAASFIEVAGVAIVLDAGLAYLGLADPTTSSWGVILNRSTTYPGIYYSAAWAWWVLPAAAAVTLAVLGLTFLGAGLTERQTTIRRPAT